MSITPSAEMQQDSNNVLQLSNILPYEEHPMRGSGIVIFYNEFFLYKSQVGERLVIKFNYKTATNTISTFKEFKKELSFKKDMGTNVFAHLCIDKYKEWVEKGYGEVLEGEI